MLERYLNHNRFLNNISDFERNDPHLMALSKLAYQHSARWWHKLDLATPGIYILTGGRQVGKSTSCKQLLEYALNTKQLSTPRCFYLPCDEIFTAEQLSITLRYILDEHLSPSFMLIVGSLPLK